MRRSNVVEAEKESISPNDSYLFVYNFAQAVGWSLIALKSCFHLFNNGSYAELYSEVDVQLKVFQTIALLEIIHASIGLVKSNPIVTAFQVFSRVFLLWGVTNLVKESQLQIGFPLMLVAWTTTEIIRYFFYAGNIVKQAPYFLIYARYTFFIILYPIGVTGELLTIYSSLPRIRKDEILTYNLPNALNISFDYFCLLILVMLAYIPIFPQLYMHMFVQRKKALGLPIQKKRD